MKELYKQGAYKMAERVIATVDACKKADGAMLVFLHRSIDGDCIGSSTAMVMILRKLGIDAYVCMSEKLLSYMTYMDIDDLLFYPGENFLEDMNVNGKKVFTVMSVDCTESSRMTQVCGEIYASFEDSLTIDHHEVKHLENANKWICPEGSSACELVFYCAEAIADILGKSIEEIIDKRIAQSLLTGIVTDTGRFSYSNTRPETLETSGTLMALGAEIKPVCYNYFDRKSKTEFLISSAACTMVDFHLDGKIGIAVVKDEMFEKFNASYDDIGEVVSKIRDIDGVELSIVLRDAGNGAVRGNLRSKSTFDCTKLAGKFNGGGHYNASGFTVTNRDINEIREEVIKYASEMFYE